MNGETPNAESRVKKIWELSTIVKKMERGDPLSELENETLGKVLAEVGVVNPEDPLEILTKTMEGYFEGIESGQYSYLEGKELILQAMKITCDFANIQKQYGASLEDILSRVSDDVTLLKK